MILTPLDIFSLVKCCKCAKNHEPFTTWNIAEEFYSEQIKKMPEQNKQRFLSKESTLINYRFKKLAKEGLVKITKDEFGKNVFVVQSDKVLLNCRKFPDGKLRDAICVKGLENKWMVIQI